MATNGRTLTIYLAADTKRAGRDIDSFNDRLTRFAKVGAVAAGVAVALLAKETWDFAKASVDAAREAKVNEDRLRNVTKQMGLTRGEYKGATARILDYSDALSKSIGIEDDTIQIVQAKLATFGNLTTSINEAGGAFDRATVAAFDLAKAGFGTAEGNAVQLGKALNDPIKGLASLAKSGVTFTDAEKERIKTLVESNRIGDAQALVLAAIEKQVGGTAAATATASDKMSLAWGELQESIGTTLLPAFDEIATGITNVVIPALQKVWEWAAPKVTAAWGRVKDAFTDFRDEFKRTDWSPEIRKFQGMADDLGAVGEAWSSLYDTITGSKSTAAEKKQHSLISIMQQYVEIMSGVVAYYSTVWRAILTALEKVWSAFFWLKDKLQGFKDWNDGLAAAFREQFARIGGAIVEGFKAGITPLNAVIQGVKNIVNSLPQAVKDAMGIRSPSRVFIEIGGNIVKGFEIGVSGLKDVTDSVAEKFNGMADTVADRIEAMTDKAKEKLRDAKEAFASMAADVRDSLMSGLELTTTEAGAFDPAAWAASVKTNTDWATALRDVANNPAFSDGLVQMLSQMGPEAGLAFVQSLTPAMVAKMNEDLTNVALISEDAATAMAERFKGQGVRDAQAHMEGLGQRIQDKLDWLYDQGRKMGLAVSRGYRDATASLLESGAGTARAASNGRAASGNTFNVTVQAGIGNPIEIARTIENVLAAKQARLGVA